MAYKAFATIPHTLLLNNVKECGMVKRTMVSFSWGKKWFETMKIKCIEYSIVYVNLDSPSFEVKHVLFPAASDVTMNVRLTVKSSTPTVAMFTSADTLVVAKPAWGCPSLILTTLYCTTPGTSVRYSIHNWEAFAWKVSCFESSFNLNLNACKPWKH